MNIFELILIIRFILKLQLEYECRIEEKLIWADEIQTANSAMTK